LAAVAAGTLEYFQHLPLKQTLVLLLAVVVEPLTRTVVAVLVAALTALLEELVALLLVVVAVNLLAAHLFRKQVLHCKAVLQALKAMAAALAVAAVGIGVVVLAQTQTPALLVVAVLAISTHLLLHLPH
jgi:hypothetical protein